MTKVIAFEYYGGLDTDDETEWKKHIDECVELFVELHGKPEKGETINITVGGFCATKILITKTEKHETTHRC